MPEIKRSYTRSNVKERGRSSFCIGLVSFLSILIFLLVFFTIPSTSFGARIKELAYIDGVRNNQLIGYGIVIGLNGTGDKANTVFTTQSLSNMLERMGVKVDPNAIKVKNVAAVMVTANLPPFSKVGTTIDVTVSSLGDATSLLGGVLIMTPLRGADGEVYAVAQGPLVVGGFSATGAGATMQKNHPTVGRIPNGATIEREIGYEFVKSDSIIISLKMQDFTTARRIEEHINSLYNDIAYAKDAGTVYVKIPDPVKENPVKFLSLIENIDVKPDMVAKIVVDEKTGTIVIGENVRISTVAISQGNISVMIKEDYKVSQPLPFAPQTAQTVVTPDTRIRAEEDKGKLFIVEGDVTIRELVAALNAVGVSTREMISILQAIKAAGALHAELEII